MKPSDFRAPFNSNVYENDKVIVSDNGSSEIIVHLKDSPNTSVRITPEKNSITVVSQDCEPRLFYINGLHGLRFVKGGR